jgi:transposase
MFTLPPSVKIYLATAPTDMRKGHDSLAALVKQQLGHDVYSGHLFAFVSRRGDRVKILTWDHGGFILWYKRLESGRFRVPELPEEEHAVELEAAQLAMLMSGIDYSRVRKPKRWEPKKVRDREIAR